MHLSEEQVQRFLHGELDARSKEALSLHVAECNTCAQKLAEGEREEHDIFNLLSHVDHPAPRVDAESFMSGRGTSAMWGRRAAGFVVVAALAGAAYAIPGSPLPAWVKQVAGWITGGESPTPPVEDPSTTSGPPVTSGIAVPVHGRFTIQFTAEQTEGVVVVSLTDEANIFVRVLGGTATFTTDADRLTIANRGSTANYEIEIPRDAAFVEVSIGTRQIVLKDGGAFATGLSTDERGRTVLPFVSSPRSND